jgi:hypothetical protein
VTASWLKDTSPPRTRGGAISEMYSGATKEAVPTASPRKNRKPVSMAALTDNAQPSGPTR